MPKISTTYHIDISLKNFLNHCSPNELKELEFLLSTDFYQDRKNLGKHCRVCGRSSLAPEPLVSFDGDICNKCSEEIEEREKLLNSSLATTSLSIGAVSKLQQYFIDYNIDNNSVSSLQNFNLKEFSMIRGNGKNTKVYSEILKFLKQYKIPFIK